MNKTIKRLLQFCVILLIATNLLAIIHAYKFTHFSTTASEKVHAEQLTFADKLKLAFTGISTPRPVNKKFPQRPYETIYLQSNKRLECWLMNVIEPKGTIIIFHGYTGEKSGMLNKAYAMMDMGYNVFLVDFMGAGGSEGNQVTLGYHEAAEVKDAYLYIKQRRPGPIYLMGTSMGAAAILKAVKDDNLKPTGVILECPFATMYDAVEARFKLMHAPSFPMAGLLVFWGGVENNFWAFGHNPKAYARFVHCPALLLYGAKDDRVTRTETDAVFRNLAGKKYLRIYPEAKHEDYLMKYQDEWISVVSKFLQLH